METWSREGGLARRVAVTVGVLALYFGAHRIALPGLDPGFFAGPRLLHPFNVVTVGLYPWILAFFLVELLSLLPGPWRVLRQSGVAGRRKLDRFALVAGLLFSLIRAEWLVRSLEGIGSVGRSVTIGPGWSFRLLFLSTALAGSVSVLWLARILSRYGLGHGICWLVMSHRGLVFWTYLFRPGSGGLWPELDLDSGTIALQLGAILFVTALFLVYALRLERPREPLESGVDQGGEEAMGEEKIGEEAMGDEVIGEGGAERAGAAPPRWQVAFPQSVMTVWLASHALLWLLYVRRWWPGLQATMASPQGRWVGVAGLCLLVPLIGWLLLRPLSGAKRISTELPVSPEEAAGRAAELARRFLPSTVVLVVATTGLVAWRAFYPGPWSTIVDSLGIARCLFFALDLVSEWRFTAKHGPTARVAALNNVHLAPLLVERLAAAGIPATLQGFRYRTIGFAYYSLIRIGVLVPTGRLDEAQAILDGMEVKVV